MKTSILTTDFNFAKSINLSLIAAPDAYDPEEIEPDFTFNIEYITFQVYFN